MRYKILHQGTWNMLSNENKAIFSTHSIAMQNDDTAGMLNRIWFIKNRNSMDVLVELILPNKVSRLTQPLGMVNDVECIYGYVCMGNETDIEYSSRDYFYIKTDKRGNKYRVIKN